MKDKQKDLFNNIVKEDWEVEWIDMPEFKQEDLSSYKKLVVHFKNDEDIATFAKLVNQKITFNTPSIWFPELKIRRITDKVYIDES